MTSAHYRPRTAQDETPLRRRLSGLALALAVEILLILAFLTLDFTPDRKPEFKGDPLAIFDLAANQDQATASKAQQPAPAKRKPLAAVLPKPKIVLPPRPLDLLPLTRQELEAADIAKLGTNAAGAQLAQGSAPGDSARVGTGPNGEPLYAAEWYREPTNQELSTYMPKRMPEGGGWGLIACRTAERYRVTDCVELGQSPAGSHLASAVRQAAWQFLVRPPRVGGKPLVGEWVSIRITYNQERPSGS